MRYAFVLLLAIPLVIIATSQVQAQNENTPDAQAVVKPGENRALWITTHGRVRIVEALRGQHHWKLIWLLGSQGALSRRLQGSHLDARSGRDVRYRR